MLIEGRSVLGRLRADAVVIGAGPAGITITEDLARAGLNVVLLEAGGAPTDRPEDDGLRGVSSGVPFPLVRSRRQGFGGSSGHWTPETGLRIRQLDDVDFEARSGRPGGSWPFGREKLALSYAKAHDTLARAGEYAPSRWFTDADTVTPLAWPDGPELAMFQFADHDCFVRRFGDLVAHPHVDIVLHAPVRAIELTADGGAVASVAVRCDNGNEFGVDASTFVLAAGGIDNARILLASPGRNGAGVGNETDNVGRWFMDHLSVDTGVIVPANGTTIDAATFLEHRDRPDHHQPMLWLGDDIVRREDLPNAAFWLNDLPRSYLSGGVSAARSLKEALLSTPRRDLGRHLRGVVRGAPDLVTFAGTRVRRSRDTVLSMRIMIEQIPDRESRVRLAADRDRTGMPRVDLDWRISAADLHAIRRHQDVLARLLEERGVGTVVDRFDPGSHHAPIMSNHHHIGTTRMHSNPRHGVVDAECRVHGTPNLFVAGSSVFPAGGYLNPTLTIVALAHRVAGAIQADLSGIELLAGS